MGTMKTLFTLRRQMAAVLLGTAVSAILAGGCTVDKAATPEAEISAAVKTRDDAKTIQADSKSRVNDADAVLGGK